VSLPSDEGRFPKLPRKQSWNSFHNLKGISWATRCFIIITLLLLPWLPQECSWRNIYLMRSARNDSGWLRHPFGELLWWIKIRICNSRLKYIICYFFLACVAALEGLGIGAIFPPLPSPPLPSSPLPIQNCLIALWRHHQIIYQNSIVGSWSFTGNKTTQIHWKLL